LWVDPLERLISGFKKYLDELPQEKIYVHFDRPYYASGEIIWFKAYLTAGPYHEPSQLSRTVYVELINERRKLVKHVKLLAIDGSASGDIVLDDSLSSGNYVIRAYTHWMKNCEEDYFFHRSIKIWNQKDQTNTTEAQGKSISINFFPEGGELVNGILSKVAFKVVDSDGLGREIKGKVVDELGELVCEFKSNTLGMGAFPLVPKRGKTYLALIDNFAQEVKLPVAKDNGLVMSVKSTLTNEVAVRVQTTDFASFKTIFIVAQVEGVVCYAAKVNLTTNIVMAKIPKSLFPPGVAQISITDTNANPIAERLVFVNEGQKLFFEINSDKKIYSPRELITISILAKDANAKPTIADISLAVCDNHQVHLNENGETINTYLLLSSELRGNIESPGYYFNPKNENRVEALDHLLLTQGWRRFTFKKAMAPNWQKPQFRIEQGLTIKGTMVDKERGMPIAFGKVSYLNFDPPVTRVVQTNGNGYFEINDIIYFDNSSSGLLQGETNNGGKKIKFIIESAPMFVSANFPNFIMRGAQPEFDKGFINRNIEQKNIEFQYDNDKSIVLKEVEIKAKGSETENGTNRIFGKGTVSVRTEDDPSVEGLIHPLQLIQGRVAGVQITGAGQNWNILIRGVGSINSGTTPLIMIDNVAVSLESLNLLSPREIESFDVWKGADAAIFGARGANGAIGFYTKKGVQSNLPKEGILSFGGGAFQVEREFYSPRYDVKRPEHIKPDKRTTLFWAPHVRTDSTGHATVSFYNHDVETTVTGVLEGISRNGEAGTTIFNYEIKKK